MSRPHFTISSFPEDETIKTYINDFSERWVADPHIQFEFLERMENFLGRYSKQLSPSTWTNDEHCFLIILNSFIELRNCLVKQGFYSFRKKETENLLQLFFEQFNQDLLINVINGNQYTSVIQECQRFFSSIINPYTNLNKIEESVESIEAWANIWLTRPHFTKYKSYFNQLSTFQTQHFLKNYVIKDLVQQQHHPPTRRTLFKILGFHKEFEVALTIWKHSHEEIFPMSLEEKEVVNIIAEEETELIFPYYFHWIEQLIEKKTSSNYKLAITLLSELYHHALKLKKQDQFMLFMTFLFKKYKHYTAFYKELTSLADTFTR
ncbi:hypothetical protein HXA31_09980 [Salipaludibacillus agaradhaerens]|uniref:Uncharacterized protein n=1 Tax=Salipaludibacillus agaradhaerens TaxID=76935 RepID=A0A9Q4AZQ2_SALAG|nr:hypothetical protein [Salipaludibacillus agaradhaerens]MCR6095737.1 hypothetical protein [Salipaludibacillus agaradhaerens]MCR6114703.1 hypothetical protein [Salipaludibacillus agaradhaerens]